MQQDHRHAGGVGFAVELADERGADAGAALCRLDEHQHQVGRGRQARHGRNPARGLRPLRGQQRHRVAVTFGQPRPGRLPSDQPRGLAPHRVEAVRPLVDGGEARVEPDDLHAQPGDGVDVARPGPPDSQAVAGTEQGRVRGIRRSGSGPRGEDLKRVKPVPQQRGDPVHVAAGPVDDRRGVRITGSWQFGQVVAPQRQQPAEPVGHARVRDRGRELEPAGGAPGQVERPGHAGPVLAPSGGDDPAVSGDDERRAAVRRRRVRRRQ